MYFVRLLDFFKLDSGKAVYNQTTQDLIDLLVIKGSDPKDKLFKNYQKYFH